MVSSCLVLETENNPWLVGLPEVTPKRELEPIVATPEMTSIEQADAPVRELTDQILDEAMEVIQGVVRFADIPEGAEDVPVTWVNEYGAEKAEKMRRLAVYGQLNSKDAPVGIKNAIQTALGIMKVKAATGANHTSLNAVVVQVAVNTAPREYPRKRLDVGDR